MIGTASSSAVASCSSAAVSGGGGGLDDINLYDISAEDMLDIWGDHHMDTAAAEAEVGIREFIGIALHRQRSTSEDRMAFPTFVMVSRLDTRQRSLRSAQNLSVGSLDTCCTSADMGVLDMIF